jgi:hypothetical protein
MTQNFTRKKLVGGAYNESGSRIDFLYRNVTPEIMKSIKNQISKYCACITEKHPPPCKSCKKKWTDKCVEGLHTSLAKCSILPTQISSKSPGA